MEKMEILQNFIKQIQASDEYDVFIKKINESICLIYHKDDTHMTRIMNKMLKFDEEHSIYSIVAKRNIVTTVTLLYYKTFFFETKKFFSLSPSFLPMIIEQIEEMKNVKIYNEYDRDKTNIDNVKDFIDSLHLPFQPMPHQYDCFIKSILEERLTNESATSSGKSLIIYMLAMYMIRIKKQQVCIIVPTINLVNQLLNDFKNYGISDDINVSKVNSTIKNFDENPHLIITTWQTLVKKSFPYDIEKIGCVIVDECHILKKNATQLQNFLNPNTINARYRYGFSGTIPKNNELKYNIMSYCGMVNSVISTKQLIEENKATNVIVKCINLHIPKEIHKRYSTQKFTSYQQRYIADKYFLYRCEERNNWIVGMLKKIYKNKITLVLYDSIELGERVKEMLIQSLKSEDTTCKNFNIFTIDGSVEGKKRENIRQHIEDIENGILFGTHQCMSTGVNIPKLNTMVYLFSTKSEITINQSIGRLIRKHQTKDIVTLIDIVDNLDGLKRSHFAKSHFKERLKIYEDNKYEIQTYDAWL